MKTPRNRHNHWVVRLTLLGALASSLGVAATQFPAARVTLAQSGPEPVVLPFENYRRWMVVRASVAGSEPLRFILDSGAPVVVLTSRELGERLPLQIVGQASIGGAGDGADEQVALAVGVTVEMDGVRIDDATMAVGAAANAIPGMDGILGGSLFGNLVVEIDWAGSRLLLHDPDTFVYAGDGVELPLDMLPSGHFVVQANVQQGGADYPARLLVDTGAGHALSVEPSAVPPGAALTDLIIGWGSNGVARGDIGRVDALQLGTVSIADVITSFPAGRPWARIGAAQDEILHGNVGQQVLQRFRVIFDAPGGRLILEPGPDLHAPFAFDTTGLALAPWSPGTESLEIAEVIPGSPAEEAGVRIGDRLLAIDGREVSQLDPTAVEELLWGPPGGEVELAIGRGSARSQHRLTRRKLLR
ncbi:MAG: PDZ domain-containing protein [Acidobacteria bacterium]|nr:PDZ domain-containing protein [Acidobacteriota bacterium]